ncbi:hypothetical protein MRX96_054141 [Rhipicephalus microplus]
MVGREMSGSRCERVRRHVVEILRLKNTLNLAIQWPVVAQCASSLLLVCACIQKLVVLRGEHILPGQLWVIALIYLPYVCVGIIDLAILSHILTQKRVRDGNLDILLKLFETFVYEANGVTSGSNFTVNFSI